MKKIIIILCLLLGTGNVYSQSNEDLVKTKVWLEVYGSKLIYENPPHEIYGGGDSYKLNFNEDKIRLDYNTDLFLGSTTIYDMKTINKVTLSKEENYYEIIIRGGKGKVDDDMMGLTNLSKTNLIMPFKSRTNATTVYEAFKKLFRLSEGVDPMFVNEL